MRWAKISKKFKNPPKGKRLMEPKIVLTTNISDELYSIDTLSVQPKILLVTSITDDLYSVDEYVDPILDITLHSNYKCTTGVCPL